MYCYKSNTFNNSNVFVFFGIILLHYFTSEFKIIDLARSHLLTLIQFKMSTVNFKNPYQGIEKILMQLSVNCRKVLNSSDAAVYLRYTRGHVYRLVKKEKMPHYRSKGRLYFKRKQLNFWMISRKETIKDQPAAEPLAFHQHG